MPQPPPASDPVAVKPPLFLTPVQAQTVARGSIAAYFETTARIEAEKKVDIPAKGSGLCLRVLAEIGDAVRKGDVLAELDRRELEAQTRQARVSVEQQKSALDIAEQSLREGIGTTVERDNARFAHEQARSSLELTEIQLAHQTIRAPIGGVITQRLVREGMSVVPGPALFQIVDPHSYVLPIHVPEKEVSRLHMGQEAQVRIDATADRVYQAQVRQIHPAIDPVSGTVRVLLDFQPEDHAFLRESAFARVRLLTRVEENALLAPRAAILEEEGRNYVFTLAAQNREELEATNDVSAVPQEEGIYRATRTEIQTGLEQSDAVEVLSGISDTDLVVIQGQHSLKPDTLVRITNLDRELADRAALQPEDALKQAETQPDEGDAGV